MQLTDEWGTLEARNGALMGSDMKTAPVPAPLSKNAPLSGNGWTLTLKPGWSLIAGSRPGDFTLKHDVGNKPSEKKQ